MEWADHLRRNHARLNRKDSRANRAGPRKRCDFCGDQVILSIIEAYVVSLKYKESFSLRSKITGGPN